MATISFDKFRDVDLVIDKASNTFIPKQFVSQGDTDGRTFTLQLTEEGMIGQIQGVGANLLWSNEASGIADVTKFSLIDTSNSILRVTYPEHMMTPGKVKASVQITYGGKSTVLRSFDITVQALAGRPAAFIDSQGFAALASFVGVADGKVDKNGVQQVGWANLAEDARNNIAGDKVAYVGPESVGPINIIKGSVGLTKTTFSESTKNLFDLEDGEIGKYPVWNTGKLQENALFSSSDWIAINPGRTYIKSDTQQLAFYSSKSLASYVSGIATVANGIFTAPSAGYYVRLAIKNSAKTDYMLVEGTELPSKFVPAKVINSKYISDNLVEEQLSGKSRIIPNEAIKDNAIELEKVAFAENSKNLFDSNKVTSGRYPVWNTGKLQENALFSSSDWIAVIPGETYIKSDTQQMAFYNSKSLDSYVSGISTVTDGKFTVPKNGNFALLAVRDTLIPSYMTVKGDELPTKYVSYQKFISTSALDPELVAKVNYIPTVTQRIIDSKGRYDYKTIQEFIENEETSKITGYILNGQYNEQLEVQDRKVTLIGESKQGVLIYNTAGTYDKPPINFGWGVLKNLSIYAKYVSGESTEIDSNTTGAYGIHLDSPYAGGQNIEFNNLDIRSDFFPAIGCGLRKDSIIDVSDLYLFNGQIAGRGGYSNQGTLGAFYIHDDNRSGVQINQKLIARNVIMESNLDYALCINDLGKVGSQAELTFVNSLLYSHTKGKSAGNIWFRGKDAWQNAFSLNPLSYGNSNSVLNA